jgi:hypothetical protein
VALYAREVGLLRTPRQRSADQAGTCSGLAALPWRCLRWAAQSPASRLLHYYPRQPYHRHYSTTPTTSAACNHLRKLDPITKRASSTPTEQTPTSASRPDHGPTYAARWSPRRRAIRTVQACASGSVAISYRSSGRRYTDGLEGESAVGKSSLVLRFVKVR